MKKRVKKSKPPRGWETRNKIFEAALALRGQPGVTQIAIAKKAGVQKMRVTEHMMNDPEVDRVVKLALRPSNKDRILSAIVYFQQTGEKVSLSQIMRKANVFPDTFYYWVKHSVSIKKGVAQIRKRSGFEMVMDAIKQLQNECQYLTTRNICTRAGIGRRTFVEIKGKHPEVAEAISNGIVPQTARSRLVEKIKSLAQRGVDLNLSRRTIAKMSGVDRETLAKYEGKDSFVKDTLELITPMPSDRKIALALHYLYLKSLPPSTRNIARQAELGETTVRLRVRTTPDLARQIELFKMRLQQRKSCITTDYP